MLANYIKVSCRNIAKHRFHSAINVFGLSVGIAFTFLIGSYVWNELQVNEHLRNADRQFIIQSKWKDPNLGFEIATLGPLAKELKTQYPSLVANYYRFDGITSTVSKGDKYFRESIQVGDTTLLKMYGFPMAYGDAKTAFKQPFSVLITEEKAIKYFGRTNVIGETLNIGSFSGGQHDFMITGVLKNIPENSITKLNAANDNQILIPEVNLSFFGRDMNNWNNNQIASFVELQPGVSPAALAKPIAQLINANASPELRDNVQPFLVPLNTFHISANKGLAGKMLYTISFIALFILLMAIVNFVNISISRSSGRLKEIGVRKVLGSIRRQLVQQFLTEAIILVAIATAVALGIYQLLRPLLSDILGKQIVSLRSFPIFYIFIPIILVFVIGVLAGIYPALVLSSLKTCDTLKGKLASVKENVLIRKSLVGFQFLTASVVFAGALVVSQQVSLFFSKDLGYDKEFIVSAQIPRDWTTEGVQKKRTIRNEFAAMPEVANVSLSFEVPNGMNAGSIPFYKEGSDSSSAIPVQQLTTDEYYTSTFKIPVVAGRFFRIPYDPNDSVKAVINEAAVKALGFTNANAAVGQKLLAQGGAAVTITGVTKDFHFGSMQQQIQPITFINVDLGKVYRFLSFKLKPGNIKTSIEALQKKWSSLMPGAPFEYAFMDDTLARLYQSEIQLKKAAQASTVIALIIVVLGVAGLTSVSVQKRTKEIGIRKVLGADVPNIIRMFLREFIPVIMLAGFVSIPIAYYLLIKWLDDYSYKVAVTAQPFLTSIFILTLLTTFLIAVQIAKTAVANPIKSLRTE